MTKARIQLEFTQETMRSLEELRKQLPPSRADLIRNALAAWRWQIQASSVPFVMEFENGAVERNTPAEREIASLRQSKSDLSVLLSERDEEIRQKNALVVVLTVALNTAQEELARHQTPEAEAEVEETSLLLTLWNATSLKPGIAGFSVDMKMLAEKTRELLDKRSNPLSLGLTDPPEK